MGNRWACFLLTPDPTSCGSLGKPLTVLTRTDDKWKQEKNLMFVLGLGKEYILGQTHYFLFLNFNNSVITFSCLCTAAIETHYCICHLTPLSSVCDMEATRRTASHVGNEGSSHPIKNRHFCTWRCKLFSTEHGTLSSREQNLIKQHLICALWNPLSSKKL